MPGPLAFGIAVAATALANWACGEGSKPNSTDTRSPTPRPDSGNPEDADGGAGFSRPDVFIPDVTPRPDIRDVYIPPDTGPTDAGLSDVGFTDSGLDTGTPDLGVMDAGRPPCNPTNLEAFDGYDDNCNGNNNALSEMKQVSIFFEELARRGTGRDRKVIAMGDINNDGYGDLALGAPTLGAVWVYLGGRDSPQLTHYEPGSTIAVKSMMGNGWGLELTSVAGQTTTLPASRGFVIHEDYSENTMGLGDELAVVRVTNPITGQRYNELWIGADAFNHSYGSGAGNRLDTGAIFRLDARGNNPATRMVSHAIAADPVALAALNISVILGEERQGPPSNPTRPGSILGSEIIPAGDVNGFPNGAEEVVLPYFQQKRIAIVSALAVTQPSQRIQMLSSLQPGQGHFFDGGIYFGRSDEVRWAFGDIDGDGRNDMCVGYHGDSILDWAAGRIVCMTHLENLPFRSDPFNANTLPSSMRVWTFLGLPGINGVRSGSFLGDALAMGDFDRDGHADIAAGASALNNLTGALYTLKGSEVLNLTANSTTTLSGPTMGGRLYHGQPSPLGEGFTAGGIVSADTDGDQRPDFVASTPRRSQTGQPPFVGGADLICSRSMNNGALMPTNQGLIDQNADERVLGETQNVLREVKQTAVYDLNDDGPDEIGICTNQASCIIFMGSR